MSRALELAFIMGGKLAPDFMNAAKTATAELTAIEKKTKDIQKASARRASANSWKAWTRTVGGAKKALGGLKSELAGTFKIAAGLFAGNGLIGGALYGIVKASAASASAVADSAKMIGMSTDKYREFSFAAEMAGLSEQEFTSMSLKLGETRAKALAGNQQAMDAFLKAGVSLRNGDGSIKTTTELYGDLADAYANMGDAMGKSVVSKSLFGNEKAMLMLDGGRTGLEQRAAESRKYDARLGPEDLINAAAFTSSFGMIKRAIRGVSETIGQELWPMFTGINQDIGDWIAGQRVWLAEELPGWVNDFKDNTLPELKKAFYDAFAALKSIGKTIDGIAQSMGGWVPAIKGMVIAWGAWRGLRIGWSLIQTGLAIKSMGKKFLDLQYAETSVRGALTTFGSKLWSLGKAAVGGAARGIVFATTEVFKFGAAMTGKALSGVGTFIASVGGKLLPALGGMATALYAGAAAAVKFGIALMMNPVGLVIAGIVALGGAIYLCVKYWDDITATISTAWEYVKGVFVAGWNLLPGWLQEPLTAAYDGVVGFGQNIIGAFGAAWDSVTARFDAVVDAFDGGLLNGLSEAFKQFNLPGLLLDAVSGLSEMLFGFDLKSAGMELARKLGEGILSAWEGIKDSVKSAIVDWIPGGASILEGAGAVASSVSGAFSWTGEKLSSVLPAFADGGIVTGPQLAMVGEAGPEAIIPLTRTDRAGDLMNTAAEMLGMGRSTGGGGGDTYQITFSPRITISGGKEPVAREVRQSVFLAMEDLRRMLDEISDEKRRTGLA